MQKKIWSIGLLLGALAGGFASADTATSGYHVTKSLPVTGDERWDYLTVDPVLRQLWVPRSTMTQVLDEATGKVIATFETKGPHGVALVPELHRAFITCGQESCVNVVDTTTDKSLMTVATEQGPDGIVYDPSSKMVFSMNGRSNSATAIPADAATADAKTTTIQLPGRPETPVADGAGHLFINIEDKGEIVAIDTKTMKITATWPLTDGDEPSGLAIDPATHRLFSGCANHMVIVNSDTGAVVGLVPIADGVDACGFDPATKLAFASCGEGTLSVIHEDDADHFTAEQPVQTARGARTMGLDTATHAIYLPDADMLAPPPTADGKTPATSQPTTTGPGMRPGRRMRPKLKPGSFHIIVVEMGTPAAP
jgi:hypothetical protein